MGELKVVGTTTIKGEKHYVVDFQSDERTAAVRRILNETEYKEAMKKEAARQLLLLRSE